MNKYRLYTGPTVVKTAAEALRAAGLEVVVEGTEHVYVLAPSNDAVLKAVNTCGPGWNWRDVYQFTNYQHPVPDAEGFANRFGLED